jgi:hypothetical protein
MLKAFIKAHIKAQHRHTKTHRLNIESDVCQPLQKLRKKI